MNADLPVGLRSEPELLLTILKLLAGAGGCFLLLVGRRFEKITCGIFFLGSGLALAWSLVSFYPAILGIALIVFAVGMALVAFVRRLALAVAVLWVAPAIFAGYLIYTGSFDAHATAAIALTAACFVVTLVVPSLGAALLSAGAGALLLEAAFSFDLDYPLIMALGLVGAVWQAFFLPVPPGPRGLKLDARAVREKGRRCLTSIALAALVLAAGVLLIALSAPEIRSDRPENVARMEALKAPRGKARLGLVLSAEDSYYLCGRAFPIALLAGQTGPFVRPGVPFVGSDLRAAIHELRAIKDAVEIEKMRRAADITSQAFAVAQPLIKPGAREKDVERAILGSFRANGATGLAFECIVGSGPNAVNPHYMRNSAVMRHGLVVIDIGCSYQNYASDMTRTFPVSGRWSPEGRKLVETVVAAQEAARAKAKPGATMGQMDKAAREVIAKAGFGDYFTHFVGHPVGLDVHDPFVKELKAGMVVTVEPGIYIPAGSKIEKAYWDLGVRVEDSVLITQDGCEEITHFPKIPE